MSNEEYPERIYLHEHYPNEIGKSWLSVKSDRFKGNTEYTRSDLIKDLLDKEYKRGFEEGQVFGTKDD